MRDPVEIRNGRVVTPTGVVENGWVLLDGSRIKRIGTAASPRTGSTVVDADGRIVMPGIIDLHGDDIEDQLYPRSNARVDASTALAASDRENLLEGITTKFHAVAFEDTPNDNRTIDVAAKLGREISAAEHTLGDNRLHARCELNEPSVSAVERLCEDVNLDLLSVMHHEPGGSQYDDESFRRHYVDDRGCSSEDAVKLAAERRALSRSDRRVWTERASELAAENGAVIASHDDETVDDVDYVADVGASISEYPVTAAAARRANERAMVTAMGAPNLVRGGSLCDNLSVRTAIDAAAVDVLCADYHPPSMLAAPFVETGEPLADRVARVTVNPADAVGLFERGRIEPGARADLLVVDPTPIPTVDHVFVEGRELFGREGRVSRPDLLGAETGRCE